MTCAFPPELDEVQLLAFGDGAADPSVGDHLRRCPHCLARATRLARLNRFLAVSLHRLDCPPSIELGEYHLDLLPPERQQSIRAHVSTCQHCTAELRQLGGYLASLAPDLEPSLAAEVKVLIARLVSGPGPGARPAWSAAAAGLRGGEPEVSVYQADDIQVSLERMPDPSDPGRQALLGMVTGLETAAPTAAGWQVQLRQAGQPAHSAPLDELGNFHLAGLAPASYEVVLVSDQLEVRLPPLD